MIREAIVNRIIKLIREKRFSGLLRDSINYCMYEFYIRKYLPAKCFIPPVALQFEISKVCNLRCKTCEYSYQGNKGHLMSLEEFKTILSNFPSATSLDLTGIGEPFCNPDFIKMVQVAKDRGLRVDFSTNGILMKEEHMDELIDMEVDTIFFSVDASTKETHERIRVGSSFEKLIQNISALSEKVSKSRTKKTQLRLSYTISKDNVAEVEQFPQLAKKVGAETVSYRDLLVFDSGGYSEEDKLDTLDKEFRHQLREKILYEAGRLGINVYPCESLIAIDDISKKLCYRPWRHCFVDAFGNLYPCCRLTQRNIDITRFSFGNLLKQELEEIWNASEYQALRKGIAHPTQIPSLCRGCSCLIK